MMSEKYDCITFHTPACDEHQSRILNVHGPEGLDDVCPICEIERLEVEKENWTALWAEIRACADSTESLVTMNAKLRAVVEAAKRVDNAHWFAEGGFIPDQYWIALMNALKALDQDR